MTNNLNSKEIMDDKMKEMAYEKAIEGYQFQLTRYNTWMNYYAIFVGALFIAFYTITTSTNPDNRILLVIAALGLCASLCWYGALLGYRKWNGHWMQGIHKLETGVFGKASEQDNNVLKVYRNMPSTDTKCYIRRLINRITKSTDSSEKKYAAGYISTQKITGIFIIVVMLAWLAMIGLIIYKMYENCCCACRWTIGIGIAVAISIICLHCIGCGLYSSTIIKEQPHE